MKKFVPSHTVLRRPRTKPGSPERELQVLEAKKEAARFLTVQDIRAQDYSTMSYIQRNCGLDGMTKFYKDKYDKVIASLNEVGMELNTENLIFEDLYLHMHSDQLIDLGRYQYYRWNFFKRIRRDKEMLDRLESKIEDYVTMGFHLVKPDEFDPHEVFDLTPIIPKKVTLDE